MNEIYQVECRNTVLTGEARSYWVLASDCATAEKRALQKMTSELRGQEGRNYVLSVSFRGYLLK